MCQSGVITLRCTVYGIVVGVRASEICCLTFVLLREIAGVQKHSRPIISETVLARATKMTSTCSSPLGEQGPEVYATDGFGQTGSGEFGSPFWLRERCRPSTHTYGRTCALSTHVVHMTYVRHPLSYSLIIESWLDCRHGFTMEKSSGGLWIFIAH